MSIITSSRSSAPQRPEASHPDTQSRPDPTTGWRQRLVDRSLVLLAAHSIDALRISLGLVILGFGSLKFFPGASPAEGLVMQTTEALTFGMVTGTTAVVGTAVLETVIGLVLLTGRGLRPGMLVIAGWLAGIMAPVALFPGEMFPGGLPTLAAQYVLKDLILAAAAAVVAAKALGARLVPPTNA
ncbi:DoxX family protein [Intrasporangium sp.]|uniref:DoxX family protein n=1 Tax=Intrasporangium sp. TaxID=1925024 RepID=UPI0029395D41|nr:DoxX family protein [Intrasporangium sp.]MDV3222355.1 DoxX family protein [Intrasporangium sp.]